MRTVIGKNKKNAASANTMGRFETEIPALKENLGYFYIPSHANFVLFKTKHDARPFAEECQKHNARIRSFVFNDTNWIRVTIGTLREMQKFTSILEIIT